MAATLDQSLIDEIVRRILSVAQPERIILFGSRAAGDAHEGSDIDLLVMLPKIMSAHQEMVRLDRVLAELLVPIDVIVATVEEFAKWSEAPSTTLYWAKREGEVLYRAAA